MRNTTKIMTLALPVTALLLTGCTDTSQTEAETTAVEFFTGTSLEQCRLSANMSAEQISECESDRSDWTNKEFNEADYAVQPSAVRTQERNQDGYAVLVEATTTDQEVSSTVYGVVRSGDEWKVSDEMLVEEQVAGDLCYHIGGECK